MGLSIAAPVGPIGMLCIQRSIEQGRKHGLISGLGAATADAIYGAVAAFGLHFLTRWLLAENSLIRLIGGFFLLYLALRGILNKRPDGTISNDTKASLPWNYASTFLLTLTNPATILSFAAVFATLGVTGSSHMYQSATLTVSGVFLGSSFWWLFLSSAVSAMRHKFNATIMRMINTASSLIILGFGIYGVWSSGIL